ncbi:MAG: 2-oxo acid dehydrogenase subunit E2 [Deltaproteobacteria bacterium]|nr:2-oxo acid dehydrogenase subunit E2 [Deltaproteobacteria bacterium]
MYEFRLPDLGEGIHEGEILQWYVRPGDTVEEDAPLVEVETDKAAVTIPSPRGGLVVSVVGGVGDVVKTGQSICVIDDGAEAGVKDASAAAAATATSKTAEIPSTTATSETVEIPPKTATSETVEIPSPAPARGPGASPANSAIPGRPVPAAPATRRLARELGVDLQTLHGSGPGGRVLADDVLAVASGDGSQSAATPPAMATRTPDAEDPGSFGSGGLAAPPAARALTPPASAVASAIPFLDIESLPDFSKQGPVEVARLRSIRRKVARKMTTSMILVPHVAHMDDADVTDLEAFRLRMKEKRQGQPGGKLTLLSFVIRAITAGLRAAPAFNASLDPFAEEIIYKKYYNIGFAADTGHGLVVPVIKSTDVKSINEISREIEEKAALAREGKLPLDDMQGGTFTITNVGPLGGTALIPAINYPEVAILGMGRVQEKPVVREGEIVIRKILPLTLAFDHRVADGADAARFVGELVRNLSDPNLLLLDT